MHFCCRLDYEHIPYPAPSSPYGSLANNGCGAREGFGTDMRSFAPASKFKHHVVLRR